MKKIAILFFISIMAAPCLAQKWRIDYFISLIPGGSCPDRTFISDVRRRYDFMGNYNTTQSGTIFKDGSVNITAGGTISWCCSAETNPSNNCYRYQDMASFQTQSPANGCSDMVTVEHRSYHFSNFSQTLRVTFTRLLPMPTVTVTSGCTSNTITCSIDPACSVGFQWQFSETNQAPWYNFGANSATITATVDDLAIPNHPEKKYTNRYIRMIVPTCSNDASGVYGAIKFVAPPPTATCTPINPTCYGDKDGSIQVNISSAAPGINDFNFFLYKSGETNPTALQSITSRNTTLTSTDVEAYRPGSHGIPAGEYSVVVQNNTSITTYGSCKSEKIPVIIANPNPVTATLTSTDRNEKNISCHGGANGTLQVTPSGGTGSYTEYRWTPNVSRASTATGLSAREYTVRVKDSQNCWSAVSSKTLTEPSALRVTLSSTGGRGGHDVSCHNRSDGQLTATVTGGVGVYSYAWSNGRITNPIPSLGIGTYTVTVTDGNQCTATASRTLSAPSPINFSISQLTPLNCPSDVTTLEAASIVNTIGDKNYLWSSGETTQSISDKGAGNYSLTVSDGQGCSTTKSISMARPPAYTVTIAAASNFNGSPIKCHGESNGVIAATVRNNQGAIAQASYYAWKKNGDSYQEGLTKNQITDLEEGSYTAEITYNNNCTAASNVLLLSAPDPLTAAVSVTSNYSGSAIRCHGRSDASLLTAAAGGILPYTYQWNTGAATPALSGLPEGTYTVTVTDKNQCTATDNKVLTAPPAIDFSIHQPTHLGCQGDATASFQVQNVVNTVGTVNYRWSSGETTSGISGKGAGSYSLTVTDGKGCSITKSIAITDPAAYTVTIAAASDFNGSPIKCHGESNGVIAATVRDGLGVVAPASHYAWKKNSAAFEEGSTKNQIVNLEKGSYSTEVTYNNNCKATSNTLLLSDPPLLTAAVNVTSNYNGTAISCYGKSDASLLAVATGGTGTPYTYQWNTGAATSTLSGLPQGTYTVTVADKNQCTATDNKTLTAPPPIDFSIRQLTHLNCPEDATASFEVQHTANTVGAVNYRWSSGETTPDLSNKGSGSYSLTVSDAQGCSTTKSINIAVPETYTATIAATSGFHGSPIKCHGESNGVISATVHNGQGAVASASHYAWKKNSVAFEEGTTKNQIANLEKGSYTAEITYNNNCKATSNTLLLSDPDPVAVTVSATSNYNGATISCNGGSDASLAAVATGGTGTPYTYQWNTGVTTPILSGLSAGTYSVTAADQNNCSGEGSLTISGPTPVRVEILSSSNYAGYGVTCFGGNDGFVTAGGSGGTGAFHYEWSNGQTTPAITTLAAGTYSVTVKDANLCPATLSAIITTPDVLQTAIASSTDVACAGGSDGRIALSASGGAGSYQYSKDNGVSWQTSPVFSALAKGDHSFRVKDANQCFKNTATTLAEPEPLSISFTNIEPAFCEAPRGQATAVVQGGVSEYTYRWKNSLQEIVSSTATLSRAKAGRYNLTITDAHLCTAVNGVSITSADGAKTIYTSVDTKCHDSSDGSALITITEGNGPFVVQWPNNQSTLQHVDLAKGTYSVLITDANNCTVVQDVEVKAPAPLQLTLQSQTLPTCHGFCDGGMTLQATGGVGTYSYQWNGKTDAAQSALCANTYPVILQDANSCRLEKSFTLGTPDPLTIQTVRITLPTCADGCDGVLEVLGVGGNGSYHYSWDNGTTSPTRNRSCPGSYTVTVTDSKGCTLNNSLTLNNVAPAVLNLGGGVTLCTGQSHLLDAGNTWKSVQWTGDNNFTASTHSITVNQAGQYKATAISETGCRAEGSVVVQTSNKVLNVEFALARQAFVGDTIVVVDITWPLPEKTEWTWPAEMKKIFYSDSIVYAQFDRTGIYDVVLQSHLGECRKRMIKRITILEKENKPIGARLGYESFVEQFELYPNPGNGNFQVDITLAEESPIVMSVWSAADTKLIRTMRLSGHKTYHLQIDLRPLSAGLYILRLDHEKGKENLRFIVE